MIELLYCEQRMSTLSPLIQLPLRFENYYLCFVHVPPLNKTWFRGVKRKDIPLVLLLASLVLT